MPWPISIEITKALSILLILYMVFSALLSRNVNYLLLVSAFAFYMISFPLGHDTLNYIQIYESDDLSRFGFIWQIIDSVAKYFDTWVVVYVITYSILVIATYRLSKKCMNPSLLFVGVTLSPAIGLDFLSIIRQGLATAILMLAYSYFLSEKRLGRQIAITSLAVSSHTVAIIAPAFLFIKSVGKLRIKDLLFSIIFISIITLIAFNIFSDSIANLVSVQLPYMIEWYILSSDDSEQSGRFVFLYWMLILSLGTFLNMSFKFKVNISEIKNVVAFLICYLVFWIISPPMARIMWFFLPMVLLHYLNKSESTMSLKQQISYRIVFSLILLSVAVYGITLSKDSFWKGAY